MSGDAPPRISIPPTGDELVATVACDVVEWPRLSQIIRLEKEAATHYYSVCDYNGNERGIFYTYWAANRFRQRYDFAQVEWKPILRQEGSGK